MASSNYYEWLGLSVETFENDTDTLLKTADEKIAEWRNDKAIKIQDKATLHGENIKKAIRDPDEWKRIYLEYKADFDKGIHENIKYFLTDKNEISDSDVKNIAVKNKVGESYVRNICTENGYSVISGGGSAAAKETPSFTIDDLKPKKGLSLRDPQERIEALGKPDLMALLSDPEFYSGDPISENSSQTEIEDALKKLKLKWSKIPQSGPKGTTKSHIDKICSGFVSLLKKDPFSVYIQYLKFLRADEILKNIKSSGTDNLNENIFNEKVSDLTPFTEDADKARSILIAFCNKENIAYPKTRPNEVVCPFCHRSFERAEPIQPVCPKCGKDLLVQCPKCKKKKHIILDPNCDGIRISAYPELRKKLDEANEYLKSLNIGGARDNLNYIAARWQDFPDVRETEQTLKDRQAEYGADLEMISRNCDDLQFFSAQKLVEKINAKFPGFKNNYGFIYSEIANAERLFEDALKEPDTDKRINLFVTIGESITDFVKLNAELQKYPVEPVTALKVTSDSDQGRINLSWSSGNKPNSVTYVIRRKRGTAVSGETDGRELGTTQSMAFSDDMELEEGELYYYAVFAKRGSQTSPLVCATTPALILKQPVINVTPKDGCLDLSWEQLSPLVTLKLFISENKMTDYDQGSPVSGLSDSGVLIENLKNDTPYYISAYKTLASGKQFRSDLRHLPSVTPIKFIDPPHVVKSTGKGDGEYILKNNSAEKHELVFYCAEEKADIPENAVISVSDIEKKAKKLPVEKLPDGSYKADMAGRKKLFVYPAIDTSGSLTLGNTVVLTYVKPANIDARTSGTTLCLTISEWPDGMDKIIICYDFERFPEDSADCSRANRLTVDKRTYEKRPILDIPDCKEMRYYISLFACSGNEETLIGNKEVNLKQQNNVSCELKRTMFGKHILIIHNELSYRPAFTFAASSGIVPLSVEKAQYKKDFPENTSPSRREEFPLDDLKKGFQGRIFSSDSSYRFYFISK